MNQFVITSDLHLGCGACQTDKLLSFLRMVHARKLILAGDVVHSSFFANRREWQVLVELRRHDDVWVAGNHDADAERIANLVDAQWCPEYFTFESGGKKFIVTHGHQWDKTAGVFGTFCGSLATWLIAHRHPRLAGWLMKDRGGKVRQKAVKLLNAAAFCGIFAGHTHHAEAYPELGYWNLGAWTNPRGCYATVNDGVVDVVEM